jgi:hypothetical protein
MSIPPGLRRDVQLLHIILGLEIDIVTDIIRDEFL